MSVTFGFADPDDTPCRSCGSPYRTHTQVEGEEPTCPGMPGSTFYGLNLNGSNALDLLRWLGLPAEEYGEHSAADLAARCQRRLWEADRNHDPAIPAAEEGGPGTGQCRVIYVGRRPDYLREKAADLLKLAEQARATGEGAVITWG